MEYFLLITGFVLMAVGLLGSILPVLPGPPVSWVGLLMLYLTKAVPDNYWVLGVTLAVAVLVGILDYIIPAKGTKRFGGSSYGVWGTNIGLVIGLVVPIPLGVVIGPFVGALIGELLYDRDHKRAVKAATGSFVGFLASTFVKFVVCVIYFGLFLAKVWEYRNFWF
ncbi:hypothetical protein FEDK69T_10020 [Flavobacterium enshiense DK69]|uniref:Membrane protein n=1 Tax=Flavobacterium enshiense DK69 TaxID=1107311 RepID=V6SE57_9FLAO|nr:DUF456 domain-containing protein [Flavobacterium enshiense]ESU24552.1 hypothetical protein FEDK69T_10020 [Flavobacterium enshiense DK69]KGO93800.1 membrane protein [Flavobacterium enshiense DK69]